MVPAGALRKFRFKEKLKSLGVSIIDSTMAVFD
jgi:hypothetical protein